MVNQSHWKDKLTWLTWKICPKKAWGNLNNGLNRPSSQKSSLYIVFTLHLHLQESSLGWKTLLVTFIAYVQQHPAPDWWQGKNKLSFPCSNITTTAWRLGILSFSLDSDDTQVFRTSCTHPSKLLPHATSWWVKNKSREYEKIANNNGTSNY